jgi:hypothetical protein
MTQIAAGAGAHDPGPQHTHPEHEQALRRENITISAGEMGLLPNILIVLGGLGLLATLMGGFAFGARHALGMLLAGVTAAGALALGAMFFVMMLHVTGAGWSANIRRIFEQMFRLPGLVMMALFVVFLTGELILAGRGGATVSSWLNPNIVPPGDYLLEHKSGYLNAPFALVRVLVFFGLWALISTLLWRASVGQDETGDKWLTLRARFTSSWGLLVLALSSTFFAFDWLMAATDYKFFSTMWGVWYFAGSMFSAITLGAIITVWLRSRGKLIGVVTEEHQHDLAKLMFGFTVFWAYISFSQYFLIWYSNIPEETAWYLHRKEHYGWLFTLLIFGHFLLPFYMLLWRPVRRGGLALAVVGVWMLIMHGLDLYWIMRPALDIGVGEGDAPAAAATAWMDLAAIFGVMCLFTGVLLHRLPSTALIPLRDPRLPESMVHKNYV